MVALLRSPCYLSVSVSQLTSLVRQDDRMVVWWETRIECMSAIFRRSRAQGLEETSASRARQALDLLSATWSEIEPGRVVRALAERLLAVHALRAADALQLAAALTWSDGAPRGVTVVCLDSRLREAAVREGFIVQP